MQSRGRPGRDNHTHSYWYFYGGTANISSSYATGAVTGGGDGAGGLVWYNHADVGSTNISGSYATGAVTGGGSYVGGLVGSNYAGSGDSANISGSYATGAVTGGGDNVGGLIWSNSGRIWAAYATGVASGSKDSASGSNNVGGLVGYNSGGIWATYATGDASGFFRVAGLVGFNEGEDATVSTSYATGQPTGAAAVGGLIGNSTGMVYHSYWDATTSGQSHSDGGQGKTTAELQTPTFYTGIYANWNLNLDGLDGGDDPWSFGTSSHYPTLKYGGLDVAAQGGAQSQVRVCGGSGAPTLTESEAEELERAVLTFTYGQMGGVYWRRQTHWNTSRPVKDWQGVTANAQGLVIALDLSNNNLTGYIPRELSFLPELESLRLNGNATVGCVPRELGDLLLVGALLSEDSIEQQVLDDIPLVGVLPGIVENAAGAIASTVVSTAISSPVGTVVSTTFSGLQMAENALQYNIGGLNQPLCAPRRPQRGKTTPETSRPWKPSATTTSGKASAPTNLRPGRTTILAGTASKSEPLKDSRA